jgi:hypothetical protein
MYLYPSNPEIVQPTPGAAAAVLALAVLTVLAFVGLCSL